MAVTPNHDSLCAASRDGGCRPNVFPPSSDCASQQSRSLRSLGGPDDDDCRRGRSRDERHARRLLAGNPGVAGRFVYPDRRSEMSPGVAADRCVDVRRTVRGCGRPPDHDEWSSRRANGYMFDRPGTARFAVSALVLKRTAPFPGVVVVAPAAPTRSRAPQKPHRTPS